MNKWKKRYKKLRKRYLKLYQGSLLYCKKCGWNTIIPYEDTICLNCHYWEDKMKDNKMKPYEIVDGKLIIRDKQIIEKLDNLTDKELENVSQILRKDLDDKMKEKDLDNLNERG